MEQAGAKWQNIQLPVRIAKTELPIQSPLVVSCNMKVAVLECRCIEFSSHASVCMCK